jgi:SlyX protein
VVQRPKAKDDRMTSPVSPDDDTAARIARLEEHAAHQAHTIEELSDQIAEQWRTIEQMRSKLDRLADRFLVLEEGTLEAPAITRPPHY